MTTKTSTQALQLSVFDATPDKPHNTMGGTWYDGVPYYGYVVSTNTPFRYGMILEKRMTFPHEDIKLFTIRTSAYDRDDLDSKEMEERVVLIFGFNLMNITPVQFMELKQILETYMTEATFKGKEHFKAPSFLASVHDADYGDYHYDSNELEDEEDRKEYNNIVDGDKDYEEDDCDDEDEDSSAAAPAAGTD